MAVKASVTITISCYRDTESVTRFYKLQASTAAIPSKPATLAPKDWSDTEPSYNGDNTNTLYFCDRSTFSDGTFSWSSVSISSSYEAAKEAWNKAKNAQDSIDNMEIGGRNLLMYTDYISNTQIDEQEPIPDEENEEYTSEALTEDEDNVGESNPQNVDGVVVRDEYALAESNSEVIYSGNNNSLKITTSSISVPGIKDVLLKCWSNFIKNQSLKLSMYIKGSIKSKMFVNLFGGISTKGSNLFQYDITTEWIKIKIDLGLINSIEEIDDIGIILGFDKIGEFYINSPKLEYGDKFTDWSAAPEDIISRENSTNANLTDINNNMKNMSDEMGNKPDMDQVNDEINKSATDIKEAISELTDKILNMVINGTQMSVVTQTENGWEFNIGSYINDIDKNMEDMSKLAENLSQLSDDIQTQMAYIQLGEYNDNGIMKPCILLGNKDSNFKVRITNTSIDFLDGETIVAFANNEAFFANVFIAQGELQIGANSNENNVWVWKTRDNGNLGLTFVKTNNR